MNSQLFIINHKKEKHLYEVKNDQTSIDNFIKELNEEFGDIFIAISVRGLNAGKNEFRFKKFPYGFEQKDLFWESTNSEKTNTRYYYLKLYPNVSKFPFRLCNMEWVPDADKSLEKGREEDFNYNINRAFGLIEGFFKNHTRFFKVSVFCGIIPKSSWSPRCYIKVIIRLPVSGIDLFEHSGISNLTEFGQNFIRNVRREFVEIVDSNNYDLSNLFINKQGRELIAREAENKVRISYGLKIVGDTYVNETLLANITKRMFPDTIRQYKPKWLGKYILDLYVPSLRMAVEYHGEQHFKPIDRFGGLEKLSKQRARDDYVRIKCKENNVLLLEWHYLEKISEESVVEFYSKYVTLNEYQTPLSLF